MINENVGGAGCRALGYRSLAGSESLWASIRSFAVGGGEAIVTIGQSTGIATTVNTDIGPGMRSMAYDPATDRFYVTPGGVAFSAGNRLGSVNPTAEPASMLTDNIGGLAFAGAVDALAIDPNTGLLYGTMDLGGSEDLITINKSTAAVTTVKVGLGIPHVGGMTYWNGQFLAMADNTGANPNDGGAFGGKSLYTISLDGNTVTLINADVGDWIKVEFVPGTIPPPLGPPWTSIEINPATGLVFTSANNVSYLLEAAIPPMTNVWLNRGLTILGNGGAITAFDPMGFSPSNSYRLVVQP